MGLGVPGTETAPAEAVSQTLLPSSTPMCFMWLRVIVTTMSSTRGSPPVGSTVSLTSKPTRSTRVTVPSVAPSSGDSATSMSCGRTMRPASWVTSPRKLITKSLAGSSYSCSGEPICSTRPSLMTTISSATSRASSWSWVTKTVVTCTSSCSRRSQSRSSLRTFASRAPNGSSSSSTVGSTASARASAIRWR